MPYIFPFADDVYRLLTKGLATDRHLGPNQGERLKILDPRAPVYAGLKVSNG